MEYRMDETTGRSRMWDTNMNFWHDCKESPQAKKKQKDEKFQRERQEFLRNARQEKIKKLKTPIFCNWCNKSIPAYEPCDHMIADGFEVGVDGSDFYSDSFKAKERRKFLKDRMQQKLKEKTKPKMDSFF